MKKKKERSKKHHDLLAIIFLCVALGSFGLDLFHFTHHLGHDRTLLSFPGVLPKLTWKATLFALSLVLLIWWAKPLLLVIIFGLSFYVGNTNLAAMDRESCEKAQELMKESGIARDAKEDFFGRLKIKPPRSSFPPEMDKVTWWGTFKPFEFWENPQFQAVWISPSGQMVEQQAFQGGRCELAKTTLPVEKLPARRLEPGMWRVIVSCKDVVIDNHPFAVIGSSAPPQDSRSGEDSGVMIWADGVNQ